MRGSITFKIVPSYRSQSMSCEVGGDHKHTYFLRYFLQNLQKEKCCFDVMCCRKSRQICPDSRPQMVMLVSPAQSWYVTASPPYPHTQIHQQPHIEQICWALLLFSSGHSSSYVYICALGPAINDSAQRASGEISSCFTPQPQLHCSSLTVCSFLCFTIW